MKIHAHDEDIREGKITMAQFDEEIQRLQASLNSPGNDMIETEATVRKLEQLMRLDGWEPGSLSKRIDRIENALAEILERLRALERKPNIGFGKSD